MSLNIVHVHGFKCAGTTFAASLAANFKNDFRCIEPKTEGPLDWDKARQASQELGLRAMSSHSLRLPSILSSDIQFVHLIREPSERLISAWRFQVVAQQNFEGNFSTYLQSEEPKNHQSVPLMPSNYEDVLRNGEEKDFLRKWFRHRPSLFLGVVERYDESMTILELILRQRAMEIDLSYPVPLNQKRGTSVAMEPDVGIPNEFVNIDTFLFQLANVRLDFYISLFPDFSESLDNYKARCRQFNEPPELFSSRFQNENWLHID